MDKFLDDVIDGLLCLIVLMLSGLIFVIQSNSHKNAPLYIDETFIPYYNSFVDDADKYKVVPNFRNMTTTFVESLSDGVLAYCIPNFNIIKVDRNKWNSLDELSKKLVLYHEWGHCTLRRPHVDPIYVNLYVSCPDSIMHPYIDPTVRCYAQNKEWYDKELFTNVNNRELIP